jgi:hypothetical protein
MIMEQMWVNTNTEKRKQSEEILSQQPHSSPQKLTGTGLKLNPGYRVGRQEKFAVLKYENKNTIF